MIVWCLPNQASLPNAFFSQFFCVEAHRLVSKHFRSLHNKSFEHIFNDVSSTRNKKPDDSAKKEETFHGRKVCLEFQATKTYPVKAKPTRVTIDWRREVVWIVTQSKSNLSFGRRRNAPPAPRQNGRRRRLTASQHPESLLESRPTIVMELSSTQASFLSEPSSHCHLVL